MPEGGKGKATHQIACLHINGAGSGKLAHQTFSGRETGDDAARRNSLNHVLGIPRHQVSVVDDVFLTLNELFDRLIHVSVLFLFCFF